MAQQNQENFFNNLNFVNPRSNNLIDTSSFQSTNNVDQIQSIQFQQQNAYSNQSNKNGTIVTHDTNSFWQNQFNNNQQSQNLTSPLQTNNNNFKRKFGNKKEFFKNKKQRAEGGIIFKKTKAPKIPVYDANIQPAQVLNEIHSNLVYVFTEISLNTRTKYICTVEIKVKQNNQTSSLVNNSTKTGGLISMEQQQQLLSDVISEFKFSGEGMSKKEAKKNCSHIALMGLYPDSYSAPVDTFTCTFTENQSSSKTNNSKTTNNNQLKQQQPVKNNQVKLLQQPKSSELKKRIDKLLNSCEKIKSKSAAQLLHELSLKIAETGKCISENGAIPEKKFCFQFKNIKDESCIPSDYTSDDIYSDILTGSLDDLTKFAHGFGKNKKEAKNLAAQNALKQFFNIEMDQILKA